MTVSAMLLASAPALAESLDPVVRETAARAVAQIRASECEGGARTGTGFVYGARDRLVTALHVVAGCERVTAWFERAGGETVMAVPERALPRADLVLLALDRPVANPLELAASPAKVDDEVEALGFYLGVPSMDNRRLRVTFGATRLASMLPASVRDELERARAIDLALEVVRMDGHLLPGLSGAPILDRGGRVVAIGSGGLKSGAASVSWGLPAGLLADLATSTVGVDAAGPMLTALFSASEPEQAVRRLTCGGLEFVTTGRRSFTELARSTDDPVGLQQLVQVSELAPEVLSEFVYDVYAPVAGGAAVALPAGLDVVGGPRACRAESRERDLAIEFGGETVESFPAAQAASVAFEQAYIERSGRFWMQNPAYSYLAPQTRFDGLVVNRASAIGMDAVSLPLIAFTTHMVKERTFAAVIAVAEADLQTLQVCGFQPWLAGCEEVLAAETRAAHAMLGVFLSTFPIH